MKNLISEVERAHEAAEILWEAWKSAKEKVKIAQNSADELHKQWFEADKRYMRLRIEKEIADANAR
jgi:hypothetical protein